MNAIHPTRNDTTPGATLAKACLVSCQKLVAQIQKTKDAILAEFREALGAQDHLLRLALNEAEALAWQTAYPHLVFPALAAEKAQALATWHARQRIHALN